MSAQEMYNKLRGPILVVPPKANVEYVTIGRSSYPVKTGVSNCVIDGNLELYEKYEQLEINGIVLCGVVPISKSGTQFNCAVDCFWYTYGI